ncbi:GATA transcription factor 26-like isoform X2 [Phragmites australis]|uniref:GATA transcription factor 26-like isoform X2 n=1 Tax=Phragmites australis TaxID=29695 RepID=UPI002D78094E|nr:GATA transcription factor 26-like isoform X2 [Phragmites australis]
MGKQGPCRHCGVTSTPLWRNGPPDKPVLCNACGSRWRTKGSLTNYTPMHRRDDIDDVEPRVSKLKPPTSKPKALKKKPDHIIMENEPFSGQNFRKMGDADPSNRSSSGSAVSYSESCAPYGVADASSAQSHAWESLVPSRKRSCVNRPKPSPVEKLAKDLNSIMHKEQLYYLSGSSEEDLLYHSETPVGSFEIGSGSVLLRHPNSKSLEEESEASSIPADNKSYITSESYSGPASFVVHSGSKAASNLNAATERPKRSRLQIEDNARRDKLHYENQHILEIVDSPLVSVDLEDVINYTNFVKYLTKEDQQQLLKLLPPMDSSMSPESLRSMFGSIQFADAIHSYQRLLGEGILDPSFSSDEEWNTVKKLALTNLRKCKWLECYKQQKEREIEETGGDENISGSKGITKFTMKPLKRPRDTHFQSCAGLKVTMRSPKRVIKPGALAPQCKSSSLPKSGYATKDLACTEGALNLFMLPPEKLSLLVPPQYTDDNSDQDLLLEIPLNARHAEAELLCQPSQLSSVTRSGTSMVRVAEEEGHLKQP